jgi:methyl-accepting chemotaxis protein
MHRFSLRSRLVAGLSLLALLTLGSVLVGWWSSQATRRVVARAVEHLSATEALVTGVLVLSSEQARAAERYAQTGAPEFAAEFRRLGDSVQVLLGAARRLSGFTQADRATLDTIAALHAELEAGFRQALELRQAGRTTDAAAAATGAAIAAQYLVTSAHAFAAGRGRVAVAAIDSALATTNARQPALLLVFGLALALAGVTAFLTLHGVQAPLRQLAAAAQRFEERDLHPVEPDRLPADLRGVARALAAAGMHLRTMIESATRESRDTAGCAVTLSTISRHVASAISETKTAVAQIVGTVQQQIREIQEADALIAAWRDSAAQDATAAGQIAASRDHIAALAERQRADLAAAAQTLHALRDELRNGSAAARTLAHQVDAVGELVDLGKQLVAQSEVLAVNAAVEAARAAGDGNGVGAIARQNRQLAEASRAAVDTVAASTTSLRDVVGAVALALRTAASQAVTAESAIRSGDVAAAELTRAAEAVRETTARLAESATQNRDLARQVAAIRNRLEAATRQTAAPVETVSSAASEQEDANTEIAQVAAALRDISERLAALTTGFRL